MRILTFDQFEFDRTDTEESLQLWIAARSRFPFPDIRSFVASAASVEIANTLGLGQPFPDHGPDRMVREYLARFALIAVPQPCNWLIYELHNGMCDWDVAFEAPEFFIRYHWWSTA